MLYSNKMRFASLSGTLLVATPISVAPYFVWTRWRVQMAHVFGALVEILGGGGGSGPSPDFGSYIDFVHIVLVLACQRQPNQNPLNREEISSPDLG